MFWMGWFNHTHVTFFPSMLYVLLFCLPGLHLFFISSRNWKFCPLDINDMHNDIRYIELLLGVKTRISYHDGLFHIILHYIMLSYHINNRIISYYLILHQCILLLYTLYHIYLHTSKVWIYKTQFVSIKKESHHLQRMHQCTLPETNSSHLKIGLLPQKETIVFQPSILQGLCLGLRWFTNTNWPWIYHKNQRFM